ncbi:hypothetical protein BE221DRAFT_202215 [Ostreococcus tauri]|uniref:Uncharacterized protein n=1 Tax=Ostreococcus tauri TaxID=70448 RepID=A0A1Y5HYJ4_OSTTA|nr:hypothetical protein BE221DRAFT_202215 [Ostreococcus tauri]
MAAAAYEEALRELGGTTNGTAARNAANAVEAGDRAGEALASAVVGLVNSTVGDDTAAALARALEAMGDETRGAATKDEDEDEDANEASSDLETYLLDTSSPKTSRARVKLVEPIEEEDSSDDVRAVGVVLADVGRSYGESSLTRTLARFASRRNAVVIRPGTCSGKPISCTGACVVDKDSVASQMKALGGGKSARLGGVAVGSAREDWMSTVAEEDSRWIGEVAHPVQFAFERMYRAARHYITSGDAEFAPVPELESCSNFTESLDVLRKKCASMRCKTGFADMQKYITATQKKTILGCPGFTSNPQTTRLRGTTVEKSETPSSAERRTRAKYAALVPIGSPEKENESLVALTYSFDFKLSDLVFHRTSGEMQDDAYDVSKEPKELRESIEGGNKIDLKLFNKVEAQIEDTKAQDTFASRLEALRGMSAAADLFCLENKVCTTGRAATKVIDVDPVHASTLGAFPASCGTEEVAKEIKCVEDWFLCDGPDASGSVWHAGTVSMKSQDVAAAGQTEKTSEKSSENTTAAATTTATATATATATTTTTTAKSVDDDGDADGPSTAETGDGKEAAESKPKPTATATAAPPKSVAFQAAANVHRQSPWLCGRHVIRIHPGALRAMQAFARGECGTMRMAAASSADTPLATRIGRSALDQLEILPGLTARAAFAIGWPEGFEGNLQIGRSPPLSSDKSATHFPILRRETGAPYDEMLFFDDCGWEDHCERVARRCVEARSGLGPVTVRTPRGCRVEEYARGLALYDARARKISSVAVEP